MKTDYSGVCDIGLKRTVNQDAVMMEARGECALFAVADGMGGHSFGEMASVGIINELRCWWEAIPEKEYANNFQGMVCSLRQSLELANRNIYERYNQTAICGATLVVLLCYREYYAMFSAGDSRIYYQRGWKFKQMTVDEVWENQAVVRKNMKKKQIREHVNYGKLLNAVGIEETASISIKTDMLKRDDKFLLCSDGLYKMCPDAEIYRVMRQYTGDGNGQEILKKILQMVYKKGAPDNVSVILVLCR